VAPPRGESEKGDGGGRRIREGNEGKQVQARLHMRDRTLEPI